MALGWMGYMVARILIVEGRRGVGLVHWLPVTLPQEQGLKGGVDTSIASKEPVLGDRRGVPKAGLVCCYFGSRASDAKSGG